MSTADEDEATQVPPAPAASNPPKAFLIVLQGLTAGQVVKLVKPNYLIGRANEVDLRLPDRGISGIHAAVRVDAQGTVSIQDLKSTNGTRVNDQTISSIRILADGDKISMGATTILKFTYDDTLTTALAAQLAGQGKLDGLTGAYRERHFRERLGEDFAFSIRHQTPLAIAVISIDYFDQLRADHGPDGTEKILADFGRRARALLGEHLFARVGRRTFAVLYRDLTLEEASALTERLRVALEAKPIAVDGLPLSVTMSGGVSALPFPGVQSAHDFLRMAEIGLMDAKQTHNCVVSRSGKTPRTPPSLPPTG